VGAHRPVTGRPASRRNTMPRRPVEIKAGLHRARCFVPR
jgi:hypothetical protein